MSDDLPTYAQKLCSVGEEVDTVAVAIAHEVAVPAQCQAHHGECLDNVHSEGLRVARHTGGPLFLHCRWITEQPTYLTIVLQIMASSSLARSRAIAVLFPLPQNVHGCVFVREKAPVAIVTADSKRSFWAAWTVMNNCRSQFGRQCSQLKESAVGQVVERQV